MTNHQDHQEHAHTLEDQEKQTSEHTDNAFKKAAMATFGAISNAVEKVAGVIDEAASPENIDKYAKKGEESLHGIKEASGGIARQVKDFGSQTVHKVKDVIGLVDVDEYKDIPSAKEALASELKDLKNTSKEARLRLDVLNTSEELEDYQEQVCGDLDAHGLKIKALIKHIKKFYEEESKEKEEAEKAAQSQEQKEGAEEINEVKESNTAHVDIPADSEVPYDTNHYPRNVYDRREHGPADYQKASRVAPDRDNNTVMLETDSRNDHLDQSWPVERG